MDGKRMYKYIYCAGFLPPSIVLEHPGGITKIYSKNKLVYMSSKVTK